MEPISTRQTVHQIICFQAPPPFFFTRFLPEEQARGVGNIMAAQLLPATPQPLTMLLTTSAIQLAVAVSNDHNDSRLHLLVKDGWTPGGASRSPKH